MPTLANANIAPTAPATNTTLNSALNPITAAVNGHSHDPNVSTGYGARIPAWGNSNTLYGLHGPGGTTSGNDWATTYANALAAVPADPNETQVDPSGTITASYGVAAEIQRIRGALSKILTGSSSTSNGWKPGTITITQLSPVSQQTGTINVSGTIQTAGQLKTTIAAGTAPLDVGSNNTKVINLNADLIDGFSAGSTYGTGNNGKLLALNGSGLYDAASVAADTSEASALAGSPITVIDSLGNIRYQLSRWCVAAGSSGWNNPPSTLTTGYSVGGDTATGGALNIIGGSNVVVSRNGGRVQIDLTGSLPSSTGALNAADVVGDYVLSGLAVAAVSSTNTVTVASGLAYVDGARLTLGQLVTLSVPLVAGTYYIDWTGGQNVGDFTVNQSGTPAPTALRLASVVSNGTVTSGVAQLASPNIRVNYGKTSNVQLFGNTSKQVDVSSTGLGFFGSSPAAKPTITGAKAGNAALTSLLSALSTLGLVTDSTT